MRGATAHLVRRVVKVDTIRHRWRYVVDSNWFHCPQVVGARTVTRLRSDSCGYGGGGLAVELIACMDGLVTRPRPNWTPEEEDIDAPETGVDAERESR